MCSQYFSRLINDVRIWKVEVKVGFTDCRRITRGPVIGWYGSSERERTLKSALRLKI